PPPPLPTLVPYTTLFRSENAAQPAVDSNGRDVLVAWFRGTQTAGGDVVAARASAGDGSGFAAAADVPTVLATYAGDGGETRPAIDRKSTRLNSSHQIISY